MPAVYLPSNPFISVFDFRQTFDLTDGTLKIDLSPSVIRDASGITGIAVKIKRPDQTVFDGGVIFTPANINSIYSWSLPKVQNMYMWGMYIVTLTIDLSGVTYPNEKKFNLCAPGDDFSSEKTGSIQLTVDCALGTLTARGFCGYAYKQMPPVAEEYNITRYYPPEAELAPQKNMSVIPFVVDAYVGLNKVKGVNVSTYDFGDSTYVLLRIVATAEKNIRCGIDFESIYCGMDALLTQMAACNASAQDYTLAFGEINALLWTVTVGVNENKDVEDHITRLEKLLGVECRCVACAGEKVGPVCEPVCPQVTNAMGIVDTTDAAQDRLKISFSSAAVPVGSTVQVKYRGICDPSANPPFTQSADVPTTGGTQLVSINIAEPLTYEIVLTTVVNGQACPPVTIVADGICPPVVNINQPPTGPQAATFTAEWGWKSTPFTTGNIPGFNYQGQGVFETGTDIIADYSGVPVAEQNLVYLIVRYPKTENPKSEWFNTVFNSGLIPDQVFTSYADPAGPYQYAWSRVTVGLQENEKKIIFK